MNGYKWCAWCLCVCARVCARTRACSFKGPGHAHSLRGPQRRLTRRVRLVAAVDDGARVVAGVEEQLAARGRGQQALRRQPQHLHDARELLSLVLACACVWGRARVWPCVVLACVCVLLARARGMRAKPTPDRDCCAHTPAQHGPHSPTPQPRSIPGPQPHATTPLHHDPHPHATAPVPAPAHQGRAGSRCTAPPGCSRTTTCRSRTRTAGPG